MALGPAVHWAGATELLSTTIPVPEQFDIEVEALAALEDDENIDFAAFLAGIQRDRLGEWRRGQGVPPLLWAFYVASGVGPGPTPVRPEPVEIGVLTWSEPALLLLAGACGHARTRRCEPMTSHVILQWLESDLEPRLIPVLALYYVSTYLRGRLRRRIRQGQPEANRLKQAFRDAERLARTQLRNSVLPEDVITAIIAVEDGAGRRLLRWFPNLREQDLRDQLRRSAAVERVVVDTSDSAPLYRAGNERVALAELGFSGDWLDRNRQALHRLSTDSLAAQDQSQLLELPTHRGD